MREKFSPWLPVIFCIFLSSITVAGNLFLAFRSGTPQTGIELVFHCFLPLCFLFVGAAVSKLQKENRELRKQIQEVASSPKPASV